VTELDEDRSTPPSTFQDIVEGALGIAPLPDADWN
jgi:hypothetical protein